MQRIPFSLWFVLVFLLFAGPSAAQVIPPIFTPLPDAELEAIRHEGARYRQQAADLEARARTLRQNAAATLQQGVDTVAIRTRIAGLESELDTQQRIRLTESTRAEVLQSQVEELRAAVAAEAARVQALETEIEQLRADGYYDLVDLERQLAEARREVAQLTARMTTLSGEAATARERAAAAEARIGPLQSSLAVMRQNLAAVRAGAATAAQVAASLQAEAERLMISREEALAFAADRDRAERLGRTPPRQGIFPVRSSVEASRFFGETLRTQTLQNMVASFAGEIGAGSLNTEVASDYKWATRFSANVIVARAEEGLGDDDETVDPDENPAFIEFQDGDAVRRLMAGGGTLNLFAIYPLFYMGDGFDGFVVHIVPKFGMDVPEANAPVHGELSLLANGKFQTVNRVFQFFGAVRASAVTGNGEFARMLDTEGRNTFYFAQYMAGVEIASTLKVLYTGAVGPGAIGRTGAFSLQLAPRMAE